MKMQREVVEIEGEGLEALLGDKITVFGVNYFYTGILKGVNETCILLHKPKIVFETGPYSEAKWKSAEALPHDIYVQTAAIEAFGIVKDD